MRRPGATRGLALAALLVSWGAVLLPPWFAGWLGCCTYGIARFTGLALAVVCSLSLLMSVPVGTPSRRVLGTALVVNLVLLFGLQRVPFRLFVHGFATRALQVAAVSDWQRLPSRLGASSEPSPSRQLARHQLPTFVAQMYPAYRPMWVSLTGTPQEDGPAVIVWWLDAGFCIGVAVGASYAANDHTLYVGRVGNGVYVIAFRNP